MSFEVESLNPLRPSHIFCIFLNFKAIIRARRERKQPKTVLTFWETPNGMKNAGNSNPPSESFEDPRNSTNQRRLRASIQKLRYISSNRKVKIASIVRLNILGFIIEHRCNKVEYYFSKLDNKYWMFF